MTADSLAALRAVHNAHDALQRQDKRAARRWAEQAARLDPSLEEPWLLLAALATPHGSLAFFERALQANPASERARKGQQWAINRLRNEAGAPRPPVSAPAPHQAQDTVAPSSRIQAEIERQKPTRRLAGLPMLLLGLCVVAVALFWLDTVPAQAFINSLAEPRSVGEAGWAPALVAKPVNTAFPTLTALPSATATLPAQTMALQPAQLATATLVLPPTALPTDVPQAATATPPPTWPPVALPSSPSPTQLPVLETLPAESPTPLPTDSAAQPSPTPLPTDTPAAIPLPAQPAPGYGGSKLILVDISQQHLYAYEGDTLIYSFVASTGMNNATRVGTFSILDKIPSAYGSSWNIWMPNWMGIYYAGSLENGIHALPILPNGQLLWSGYLGTPISYGCVVLGTYESELLYIWADVGTPVVIQY